MDQQVNNKTFPIYYGIAINIVLIGKKVRPYLIDLDSANGTFINNKKIEHRKYVELLEKDVIKFGFSSREYVLLHENSKDEAQDDDVKQEDDEVSVKKETND